MKLFVAASAIIGSTTATDAAPSCNGSPLFTVACNAETAQMTVTVDEACRQSDFRKVFHSKVTNFGNSDIGDLKLVTICGCWWLNLKAVPILLEFQHISSPTSVTNIDVTDRFRWQIVMSLTALEKLASFIDFGNSFIQGDESVNTVAGIASGCQATEYLAATNTNEYVWTLDLNGDCVQDSNVSDEGVYVFYWKAGTKFT